MVARPALAVRSGNLDDDAVGIQVGDARHWPDKAIRVDDQRTGNAHLAGCLEVDFGPLPHTQRRNLIKPTAQDERRAIVHGYSAIAAGGERLAAIDNNGLRPRCDGGQRRQPSAQRQRQRGCTDAVDDTLAGQVVVAGVIDHPVVVHDDAVSQDATGRILQLGVLAEAGLDVVAQEGTRTLDVDAHITAHHRTVLLEGDPFLGEDRILAQPHGDVDRRRGRSGLAIPRSIGEAVRAGIAGVGHIGQVRGQTQQQTTLWLLHNLIGEGVAVAALQGHIDGAVLHHHEHLITPHGRCGVIHAPEIARGWPANGAHQEGVLTIAQLVVALGAATGAVAAAVQAALEATRPTGAKAEAGGAICGFRFGLGG